MLISRCFLNPLQGVKLDESEGSQKMRTTEGKHQQEGNK